MNPQSSKINNAANYMASAMPSADHQNSNPIDTLSIEDIKYLQIYLEKLKGEKIAQNKPHSNIIQSAPNTWDQMSHLIPKSRANDMYNPLEKEVPVPIDWRAFAGSFPYPHNERKSHQSNNHMLLDDEMRNFMQQMGAMGVETPEPGSRGAACTRLGKRLGSDEINRNRNDIAYQINPNTQHGSIDFSGTTYYKNPYEYGGKDNSLGALYKKPYIGSYQNNPNSCSNLGLTTTQCSEKFPGHVRNINVESSLLQNEATHIPGQRKITETNYDRFELLPFDPQDHRHIVWSDNMPRAGVATRSERLEF